MLLLPALSTTSWLHGYNSTTVCGSTASASFFGDWQGSGLNIQSANIWGTTRGQLLIPKICAPYSLTETEDIQVRAFLFGTGKITWTFGSSSNVSFLTLFGFYTTHIRHNIPCVRHQPTNPLFVNYWLYSCSRTVVSPGYHWQIQDGAFAGGVTNVNEYAHLYMNFTYRGPIDLSEHASI